MGTTLDIVHEYAAVRAPALREHQAWRDAFTYADAKERCEETESKFTVVVLNHGGCVCTYTATRAKWKPIWGTEICPTHPDNPTQCQHILKTKTCTYNTQQRMWNDLTGTTSHGNTFHNQSA